MMTINYTDASISLCPYLLNLNLEDPIWKPLTYIWIFAYVDNRYPILMKDVMTPLGNPMQKTKLIMCTVADIQNFLLV